MANPNFNPMYSTDQIWRGEREDICLTDDLDTIEADVSALESGKAPVNHTHSGYAAANHSHDGYAPVNHGHSYNDLTNKPTIPTVPSSLPANGGNADTVGGKHASDFATASHTHSGYASASHTHSEYAASNHTHTGYAATGHTHSYNSLSDKPTIPSIPASLPANGGNADTVDGKHASDFAEAEHAHMVYSGASASTYKLVYVGPNGNDDNPGTSQTAPMATIRGAIRKYAEMHKFLDIRLLDGTYNENLGAVGVDVANLSIRSASENKDAVTINTETALDLNSGHVRLYNMTINVTKTGIRGISVNANVVYAYGMRVNVPEASTTSCINVYNGATAFLMQCVLNSGTATNSGAAVYGNQGTQIKAIGCTSERTVNIGFHAHNGTDIVYTDTITARTKTKETYYGKCVLR